MKKIKVTQEDIDHGWWRCLFNCPIVRGVRRQFPDYEIQVDADRVPPDLGRWQVVFRHPERSGCMAIRLPKEAARRAQHYDQTGEMEPFEFEIPDEALEELEALHEPS